MKHDYNCEVVRTCENVWILDDDNNDWQSISAIELLGLVTGKLSEILAECEKGSELGSLFVDIHFQQYKPLKK